MTPAAWLSIIKAWLQRQALNDRADLYDAWQAWCECCDLEEELCR